MSLLQIAIFDLPAGRLVNFCQVGPELQCRVPAGCVTTAKLDVQGNAVGATNAVARCHGRRFSWHLELTEP